MPGVPLPPRIAGHRQVLLLALTAALLGCGEEGNDLFCGTDDCFFTEREWTRVKQLTLLDPPPLDPSNGLLGPAPKPEDPAVQLGWQLYFEPALSGTATWVDTLKRPTSSARAAKNERINVSCATCHDPGHAGTDTSSVPGHVSVGAGWYDVNSQQTVNAAYYKLLYWNGRSDSLWSQAAAVMESAVSMNGNRLAIVWTVADKYRARWEEIFGKDTLPLPGKSADVAPCVAAPPACDPGCVVVTNAMTNASACHPQFPLAGKPGTKPGCQPDDATEPSYDQVALAHAPPGTPAIHDAFDCMANAAAVTRAYTNVAKLIATYEYELQSRSSPFDQFVAAGATSNVISAGAKRGLRLFVGRASCVDCHDTALFTDNQFHDIGVPQVGQGVPTEADCPASTDASPVCDCVNGKSCLPWGFYDGLAKLENKAKAPFRRDGEFSDSQPVAGDLYATTYAQPLADADRGAWRTPSLRDVALTAPYMHDGVYGTLADVVAHYDAGGGEGTPSGRKTPELHPLLLSARDRADLVEFLGTLTGKPEHPQLHGPPPKAVTP
jgi:cytochrome c peroxidase